MQKSNLYLLSNILNTKWMLDPAFAQGALPIVQMLLNGQAVNIEELGKSREDRSATNGWMIDIIGADRRLQSFQDAPAESIAHLKISGPMMRSDGLCSKGMESIGKIIKEADRSPNINAIILEFETPGGSVNGTQELANIVKNTQTKTYGYAHYACSAGYWVASACNELWASSDTAELGSIGVMSSFVDMQGVLEAQGAKFHELYADLSADKNKAFREAKAGNYKPYITEELNPIASIFQAEMRENRGLSDEAMTGKTYLAKEALKHGMIDRIAGMDELLAHIQSGATGSNSSSKQSFNHTDMSGKTGFWDRLLGASSEERELAQSSLEKLEADRDAFASQAKALSEQILQKDEIIELKNQQIESAKQQLAQAEEAREKALKLAEQYGSQPGAMPTNPKKEGQEIAQTHRQEDEDDIDILVGSFARKDLRLD